MDLKCPHCQGDIHLETVASLPDETKLQFSLTPKAGEMLSANTIGGTLDSLQKLLTSVGKSMGAKTMTFVEGVSMNDGAITFDLRIANAPKGFREAVAQVSK